MILHRGQQRPEGTVLPEIQSVAELTQKGRFKGLDQMPASGTHAGVTDNAPQKMILFPSISAEGFSKSTAISDTLHAVVREARVAVFDNSHSCLPPYAATDGNGSKYMGKQNEALLGICYAGYIIRCP